MTTLYLNTNSKKDVNLLIQIAEKIGIGASLNSKIITEKKELNDSPYNPAFVKMVLKAKKSKKRTTINPNDIWGSLGLK